jgi:beta-aspartyl-peptidase (threonine type)
MNKKPAIVIHGGAGSILRENFSTESEKKHRDALNNSLNIAYKILKNNGSAIDAVEKAVISLEDCPLFNAGRGSVFTHDGTHEMDAAIMEGRELKTGAIAGICGPKNPISLARAVMEKTEHVFFIGKSAEDLAKSLGHEIMPKEYFYLQERFEQLQKALNNSEVILDHNNDKKFGTVGAVAIDLDGNLAAATSTGGMTNKKSGRVGDTPIIGAGTYAENQSCAVSCTGHGEYFIRSVLSFRLSCLMTMSKMKLEEAAKYLVNNYLVKFGGEGGIIAIDKDSNIVMPFNSKGMYRGYMRSENDFKVLMYEDEM